MTDVERTVRTAMRELDKHGLKIGSLECHPETLANLVPQFLNLVNVKKVEIPEQSNIPNYPVATLCGIPIKQVV